MVRHLWQRSSLLKTLVVWLAIALLGIFYLSVRATYNPVNITVIPEAPRRGEPIMVTFQLNNPGLGDQTVDYRFYADGVLLKEGQAAIGPLCTKTYQYAFSSPVEIGQQVNFAVKASLGGKTYEKAVSVPSFPPQVASSFISFASFSTSVMNSMATLTYYKGNMAASGGLNAGLIMTICLIVLLILLELAGAAIEEAEGRGRLNGGVIALKRFKVRFGTLTGVLFIIFMGIVYTKIIMILTTT
ncbi:MAG: hypothetical protein K6T65_04910 [Peptococcaceae bacterium]|nr:hypothetical protein [Peptococcaceae bacterium]